MSVTASVMSSAAGVASQSPVMFQRFANINARGMIVIMPRIRVTICAYKPLLDAAK